MSTTNVEIFARGLGLGETHGEEPWLLADAIGTKI